MAKRRKSKTRKYSTRSVSYYRAPKRKKSRRSSSKTGMFAGILGAVAYGALRSKVSSTIAPYSSKIPLGVYADEAGMLLLNYGVNKAVGNKIPMLKDVLKAGRMIEWARVGETFAMGGMNTITGTNSSSNGLQQTVFV